MMKYNTILRGFKIRLELRDMLKSGLTMGFEDTRFAEYHAASVDGIRKFLRTESNLFVKMFPQTIVLKRHFISHNSTKL